ncbi:MAG: putative O-glycosylation ligase, exosortase A system-associated [Geminicoccaceae bacterium]|nr:putative O-glycosylation ligase, exosortase A system-associated [Geminicoccaceae bacterium]MCX8101451.1 putative O-glycosylation ligase, exosortase A system-associated [Geminicoccaceae bacterium]MDW8368695.1 putative O-glycosylation ligase, exosortase A system-associated [Geminicoccaceae bacterium]
MRDLLFATLIGALVAAALVRPHLGLLGYVWFSLMAPHRLTFGFAQDTPWAQILFLVTLLRWFVSTERKLPDWSLLHALLALFTVHFTLSFLQAWAPEPAAVKLDAALKLMLGLYLTTALIDRPERLRALIWVVALSVGFYGLKGGLFVLATGGAHQVLGPYPSLMADNNGIALALVMVLPLFVFLYETSRGFWLRAALAAAAGLIAIAVLGTWSRGGLLALVAMALVLWWHSKAKLPLALLGATAGLVLVAVLPEAWFAKMSTIDEYQEDASAQLRFTAWEYAWNVALASPIFGGGFKVFVLNNIRHGAGGHSDYLNAHSIYFEVLGELGFVGLALFLAIIASAFLIAGRLMRLERERPEYRDLARLGAALRVSLVGYAVGGALLNMAFFELFYHLLAIAIVAQGLARTVPIASSPSEQPAEVAVDRRELARRLLAGTWKAPSDHGPAISR